ncbi:MAG: RidA family protein [Nitrospirae bacterium]|nr:RidA family protein [Nitrospirota bacterium]
MSILERLEELGLTLPEPPQPAGSYVPALKSGNLLFLSGILPFKDGRLLFEGIVGEEVSIEDAQEASKQVVLNALAIVDAAEGLNNIVRVVRMNGYIASSKGFYRHPEVLNPASELLRDIFGEVGVHTRIAVGVYSLPLNSPVEMDFIFQVATVR